MDGLSVGLFGQPDATALIAARPTLFRIGLIGVLKDHQPGWHITAADTFRDSTAASLHRAPDIVLVDEHLPGLNGVEGLHQVQHAYSQAKILVLANTDDRERILEFIDAGAHGCLTTSASPSQVLAAFNTLLCGGVFIPAGPRDLLPPSPVRAPAGTGFSINNLTGRQRAVFDLMARGYSTKVIARELGLAVGTVKVHLAAIYRLLGAHNRTEAVAKLATAAPPGETHGRTDLAMIFGGLGWTP